MHLPLSCAVADRLVVLESVGSTNAELVAQASTGGAPAFTTIVTTDQTAGRGRLDRQWAAPAGTALAVSVLIPTAEAAPERLGWLPLMAGLAMCDAVRAMLPGVDVAVKWPNDVLVTGLKVSGILTELVPGAGAVIGAGVNLTMTREQLPTATATSLTLHGSGHAQETEHIVDATLSRYLTRVFSLAEALRSHEFDAEAAGLRSAVIASCGTIGRDVTVDMPNEDTVRGRAVSIDVAGRLVVMTVGGRSHAVAAGDVSHLRLA